TASGCCGPTPSWIPPRWPSSTSGCGWSRRGSARASRCWGLVRSITVVMRRSWATCSAHSWPWWCVRSWRRGWSRGDMIWNGRISSWTWITWLRPTWSRMVSDSGCEVRSRAHAGRSSRRPVWPCRRRFNKSNRRLPAGILRLVPRRLCDRATHGSVRRCHCILSKTSVTFTGEDPQDVAEFLFHDHDPLIDHPGIGNHRVAGVLVGPEDRVPDFPDQPLTRGQSVSDPVVSPAGIDVGEDRADPSPGGSLPCSGRVPDRHPVFVGVVEMTIGDNRQPGPDRVAEPDQELQQHAHRVRFATRLDQPDHLARQPVERRVLGRVGPFWNRDRGFDHGNAPHRSWGFAGGVHDRVQVDPGAASTRACNSPQTASRASSPTRSPTTRGIQSATSSPSASPGSRTTFTHGGRGFSPFKIRSTAAAYPSPGASWSGRITTGLPARGVQSVFSGDFAPWADVVATARIVFRARTHFSPSTTKTVWVCLVTSGSRYNGSSPGGSAHTHVPSG